MDPFVRQRRGSGGGDLNVAAGASDADYQTALSQERTEPTPVSVHFGEMSPGTLEQGGFSAGSPQAVSGGAASLDGTGAVDLPVASPFHSERVRSEVELLRSRPVTLDDDGRRAGLEIDEAALGDKGFVDSGREPDYASAEQGFRGEAPKLARVEMVSDLSAERSGTMEVPKPSAEVPDTGQSREVTGKGRGAHQGDGAGPTQGFTGLQPEASDARELIPDSGTSRMEQMMLQMMQENAVLRQRLEAVESQSSGLSGGTCMTAFETQVNSPMSFAGNVQSCVAVQSENRLVQNPNVFPGSDFQGSGFQTGLIRGPAEAQPPGMCPPPCGAGIENPVGGDRLDQGFGLSRMGQGVPVPIMSGVRPPPPLLPGMHHRNPVGQDTARETETQTLRQFASVALALRDAKDESGYHTPRSGEVSGFVGFSPDGYPLSPGGTVIRPPPGPPPMSPRGNQACGLVNPGVGVVVV